MESKNIGLKTDYMYQIIQCVLSMYTQVKIRKDHKELSYGQEILGIIVYYWAIILN